jgi:MinD superfamily P-loop ATPase
VIILNLVIASGKGGTGKTTVSVNLALSLNNVQLLDCDVEEPDCNVYLNIPLEELEKVSVPIPEIDKGRCTYCGKCSRFCQFNALAIFPHDALVFADLCHGCGGCTLLCPEQAISETKKVIGVLEGGTSDGLEFMRGVLNIGEAMASPVIRALKKKIDPSKLSILDAPPGTACFVIETISGCDFCLLVTEPTPFGLHDLTLAVELTRILEIPAGVIINKFGIGDNTVSTYCEREHIPVLLEIPHTREIAALSSEGIPFITRMPSWKDAFCDLFATIEGMI